MKRLEATQDATLANFAPHNPRYNVVTEATREHEFATSEYQRQVYPRCMAFPVPYDWRARVRYEVRHDILTTQFTALIVAR